MPHDILTKSFLEDVAPVFENELYKRYRADDLSGPVITPGPCPPLMSRLDAWQGINRYRTATELPPRTAVIQHPVRNLRCYMNNDFVDLTQELFMGKPSCIACSWDVGFYPAINSKNELTFFVIPMFVNDSGVGLDYYTKDYTLVDPVYRFKTRGTKVDAGDNDLIAWDYGHIRPIG